ncbi:MAG: ABC transporter ATP-binding protein [Betaproteobacteria bacterium]|nr:ABC transporter ATP-binding protein [Betaproteobacteria bacterium]
MSASTPAVPFVHSAERRPEPSAAGSLSIRDVCKTYDPDDACVEALRNCSAEVRSGEFVAIVGPSGCGKSTLLNMIAGFDTVSSGRIELDGRVLASAERPPLPGPDRVVVFQHGALFPWKTVLENVIYGPVRQKVFSRAQAEKKAIGLLHNCGGLDTVAGSYPAQLSSGMQRRVEIVRALMNEPKVLLLDEPFRAMDTVSKAIMHQHLLDMYRLYRKTIIFITHDLEEAIYLADTVIVMTTRPGMVKQVIDVGLPRPRVLKMLYSDEYMRLKREAAESVHEEARKAFERGEREQA